MRKNSSRHYQLSALVAAAFGLVVGCHDDTSARGESGALATIDDPAGAEAGDAGSVDGGSSDAGTTVLDGGIDGGAPPEDGGVVPDPNGTYFVSVTAVGTGCPAGSTNTSISADGRRFTITFSAFEAALNKETVDLTVTKNCVLSIKLHSPNGISYAVTSARFGAYAFLEQGVSAVVSSYYRFQGAAVTPNTNRITKVGPFDDDIVYKDDVKTADLVWSPCGVDRELIVTTQIQVRNSNPKRSGYVSITEMGGPGALELAFQSCNAPSPPAISAGKK